jgi:hypothetical protein
MSQPPASYTKGPWIADGELVKLANDEQIADCEKWEGIERDRLGGVANARLIALAPELLEALRAVSETGDDCPMCDRGRLRNPQKSHWPECPFGRALKVIAKADGLAPTEDTRR